MKDLPTTYAPFHKAGLLSFSSGSKLLSMVILEIDILRLRLANDDPQPGFREADRYISASPLHL